MTCAAVAPHQLRDDLVLAGHPRRRVEHEQHEVGSSPSARSDCSVTLSSSESPRSTTPPGVDDEEGPPVPLALDLEAVARHPGALLDDGELAARDAVHERRLADIRPADDGDDGELPLACACSPGGLEQPAQRRPVGRDDLDRHGEVLERGPVDEPALRQADIGQQVADLGSALAASVREMSGPVMRPATAMLPPKNSFSTAEHPHLAEAVALQQGRQHRAP